MPNVSPSLSSWMYFDIFPFSYFFTRSTSSPGWSDADTGVYGRTTGLPFASLSASGSEALTSRHEATGMSDASLLGSSNTKLQTFNNIALALVRIQKPRSKLSVPGRVVIMRHDFFQLEVDKVLWVQRALFLLWLGRGLVCYVVVSSSRSSCDGEQRNR